MLSLRRVFFNLKNAASFSAAPLSSLKQIENAENPNVVEELHKRFQALQGSELAKLEQTRKSNVIDVLFREFYDCGDLLSNSFWPLIRDRTRMYGGAGLYQTLNEMQKLNVTCDDDTTLFYVIPNLSAQEHPEVLLRRLYKWKLPIAKTYPYIILQQLSESKFVEVIELCQLYETLLDTAAFFDQIVKCAIHSQILHKATHIAKVIIAITNRAEDPHVDITGALLIELLAQQQELNTKLTEFEHFLYEFSYRGLKLSMHAIDAILLALRELNCAADRTNAARVTMERMHSPMLTKLAQKGIKQISLNKPYELTVEELEQLLGKLEASQIHASNVLRRLLQVYVRDEQLERAAEIKRKCIALNVKQNFGMLSSILRLHVLQKELKRATAVFEQLKLKHAELHVDEHTLIEYASLLVENRQYDKAMQLLEAHAKQQHNVIIGANNLGRKISYLLTNIAQYNATLQSTNSSEVLCGNLTLEAFNLLQNWGYCKPKLLKPYYFAPVIDDCLLRGDIRSAVDGFCQIAERYNMTPLNDELLSTLIRLRRADATLQEKYALIEAAEAQQLLSQVMSANCRVYGERKANANLLVMLAQSGTTEQIQRLVVQPEFRFSAAHMLKECERLTSKTESHKKQELYDMLFNSLLQAQAQAENDTNLTPAFLQNLKHKIQIQIASSGAAEVHISAARQ